MTPVRLAHSRRVGILNIVDDVTRANTSISSKRGVRGKSQMIVSDNGAGFTSIATLMWAKDHDVNWQDVAPGRPMQNSYIELFNGRLHGELLSEGLFIDLDQARAGLIAAWVVDYSTGGRIPRSATKRRPPMAGTITAPKGVTSVEALLAAG